jgi:hypothetical protein
MGMSIHKLKVAAGPSGYSTHVEFDGTELAGVTRIEADLRVDRVHEVRLTFLASVDFELACKVAGEVAPPRFIITYPPPKTGKLEWLRQHAPYFFGDQP